jgi:hypothetical protein
LVGKTPTADPSESRARKPSWIGSTNPSRSCPFAMDNTPSPHGSKASCAALVGWVKSSWIVPASQSLSRALPVDRLAGLFFAFAMSCRPPLVRAMLPRRDPLFHRLNAIQFTPTEHGRWQAVRERFVSRDCSWSDPQLYCERWAVNVAL